MDRCVVLVDAGYLLGAAASLLAGEPARSRITVDHAALIQGLRERAEADTQQPLLRIYWFDGAPDRVPQPEHRRLRVMPRVTVRLGALTRSDGRWAQKGVDAAMHAELTELARNRACSDVVLVTGDGDLLPGLMSAKEHGVAVHLWAVQHRHHEIAPGHGEQVGLEDLFNGSCGKLMGPDHLYSQTLFQEALDTSSPINLRLREERPGEVDLMLHSALDKSSLLAFGFSASGG